MLGLNFSISKKLIIFLCLILFTQSVVGEIDSTTFLNQELNKKKKDYKFNEYEDIIAGGIAFLIGSVGYFTTSSKVLSLTYSGIQSVGIVNIGKGFYNNLRPNLGEDIRVITNSVSANKGNLKVDEYIASKFIRYYALEDRAKRKSLFVSTSLLCFQFTSNAFFNNPHEDLKKVYLYLASVNAIIATFSYFYRSNFEKYFIENLENKDHQISIEFIPKANPDDLGLGLGLTINY